MIVNKPLPMLKERHPRTSAIMASPKAKQMSKRPTATKPNTKEAAATLNISHSFSRRIEDEREVAQRFAPVCGDGRHAKQVHGQDLPDEHEVLRAQHTAHQHDQQARDSGYRGSRGRDQQSLGRRDLWEFCTPTKLPASSGASGGPNRY